jgi:hypothetical protein
MSGRRPAIKGVSELKLRSPGAVMSSAYLT